MKTTTVFLSLCLLAALLSGCCSVGNLVQKVRGTQAIKPSGVITTETRDVSGFTALDMGTLGKVVLTQGDSEALTITGSDNVVPLVKTTVSGGVLTIDIDEEINLIGINDKNVLTFDLTVKDLTGLTVSGLADVEMDALTTSALAVKMGGAGKLVLSDLSADSIDITVSGLGSIEIAGHVTRQQIEISGAGAVENADLECQTAEVNIPGLGSATIWVTSQLTGTISGGGSVRYYGSPQTNTESAGLGKFESLGNK
jgi:uncharacterized protein YceK